VDDFLYYLLAGVCLGANYALIALGYTLVYGIIKLINFAHGEFCMAAAYAGLGASLLAAGRFGTATEVGMILLTGALAGAMIAGFTEWAAYRPIRGGGRLSALLTAIGVSLLLQNLATFINNGNSRPFPPRISDLMQRSIRIGSGGIKAVELWYIPAAVLLTLGLWYMVNWTRFGRSMRAVSQDPQAARLMGIDVDRVINRTFMIGGFFGGVSGAMMGMMGQVGPMLGFMPGLNAFVASVVGGIGSVPGAMVGGLILGVLQNMVVWLGVPTDYKDVISFVVLILVLVVRPQGLLGRKSIIKV
jgi:branched-chain amino acid transport system permease protein